MKTKPALQTIRSVLALTGTVLASLVLAVAPARAASLEWDSDPTTGGVTPGAGNWGSPVDNSNTNWWNGGQNVAWNNANSDTAIFDGALAAAKTVIITNTVYAGGITFQTTGFPYTLAGAAGAASVLSYSNLVLTGSNPTITAIAAPNTTLIYASIVATGTVSIVGGGGSGQHIQFEANTNYFSNILVGSPDQTTYVLANSSYVDFNNNGIFTNMVLGCTNLTVYTNATVRFVQNGSYWTMNYPQQLTIAGFGNNGQSGAWICGGNAGGRVNANVVLAGTACIFFNTGVANQQYTLNGPISGTGDLYLVSGNNNTYVPQNALLAGANSYTGNTYLGGGVSIYLVNGNDRLPTTTVLSMGQQNLGGGTFLNFKTAATLVLGNTNGAVNQTLAGLISGATATTDFTNYIKGGYSNAVSVLTVNNGANNVYNGVLGGGNLPDSNLALVKGNTGTLSIRGTNLCASYTVNNGVLEFTNAVDRAPGGAITNNATVAFGVLNSLTFGGTLSGSGTLTKNGNGNLIISGTNAFGSAEVAAGKLTFTSSNALSGALIVDTGKTLAIQRVAGSVNVTAGTVGFTTANLNVDLNFNSLNSSAFLVASGSFTNTGTTTITLLNTTNLTVGTYPLIKYGNLINGASSAFVLTPIPFTVATLKTNAGASTIDLVITALTGAGSALKWTGGTDNNWDLSSINWLQNSPANAVAYSDGRAISFDDSGANTAITLAAGNFAPGSIVVTNNSTPYSFSGSGNLIGAGTLTKNGSGTLIMANAGYGLNGGTIVNAGTLQIGDGSVDPTFSGVPSIVDNGTIDFNVASASSAPVISGTGSLVKDGSGTLTLNAANSYTNTTTVNAGVVQIGSATALGTAAGGTTVNAGGELDLTVGVTLAEPLSISGTGASGAGALVAQSGGSTWTGGLTVTADTLFAAAPNAALTMSGGVNAGNNTLIFRSPDDSSAFTVSSNLTAGTVILDTPASLFLTAANPSLTNILVDKVDVVSGFTPASSGLWAYNSLAFGTNSVVTANNQDVAGGYSPWVRLANNVSIPAGVSLVMNIPGTDNQGFPGDLRCTFGTGGAHSTNVWNGPIYLNGVNGGPGSATYTIRPDNCLLVFNGDIIGTNSLFNFWCRAQGGPGCGYVFNGHLNLGGNAFTMWVDNPSLPADAWFNSNSNFWNGTVMTTGTIHVGTNNALPLTTTITFTGPSTVVDLAGNNQQVRSLSATVANAAATIVNRSTNADSTLTISAVVNNTYNGSLAAVPGARALSLILATNSLTLASPFNNYTGSTTISNGANLILSGGGVLSVTTPIDVQAGGQFTVSGTTSGSFVIASSQTLTGNGQLNGSLGVSGTVAPGDLIGTFSVTGDVTNNSSATTIMEVDNTIGTNDLLNVGGTLTYNGTLVISNVSVTAYTNGQVIKLFNAGAYAASAFSSIVFPGVSSYNASNLTVDGTIQVVTAAPTLPNTPTNIIASASVGQLTLSWPLNYTGWLLQSQTNSLSTGLGTNWSVVLGSDTTNQMSFPINPAIPTAFYRLVHP